MSKELFVEKQRFSQWWVWLLFIGINGLFIFGIFWQVVGGHTFGNNPMSNTGLLISTGISLLLTYAFFNIRLETQIDHEGVHVRFVPFHRKHQHIAWSALAKAEVRTYSALGEFGGWGLRWGTGKRGAAYTMGGNKGLQLEYANGKKLLIGTQKAEELEGILAKVNAGKQE